MMVTFCIAVAVGVSLVILAQRLDISAISVLLIGGILVGPEGLGLVQPATLGDGLGTIIAICVGLILFEGGLTLDPAGYRGAGKAIRGLLTKGVLITWVATAATVRILFDYSWEFSLLTGSLIIVTGPTVIGPLLKRIRVQKRIHHTLHWEGVLIDPVGVFIALLTYEWIIGGGLEAITVFLTRVLVGLTLGPLAGALIAVVLRSRIVPQRSLNTFTLSCAIAVFAASDALVHESGLLSVTVAGFVVGYLDVPGIDKLRVYKAELTELLIGLLFILLAAKLDLSSFLTYGWPLLSAVAVVMLVVRPMNVFVSTFGCSMGTKEKLFLSWIGPRGIVAASMASLFAMRLAEGTSRHAETAPFLEAFTYSVIAGTVLFQGFTAGWVGKLLGVLEPQPTSWLVIGVHPLARSVARFIESCGFSATILDTNVRGVNLAQRQGLTALAQNALVVESENHPELYGIGHVLAITRNQDLNTLLCQRWHRETPGARLYRWSQDDQAALHELLPNVFAGQRVWGSFRREDLQGLETPTAGPRTVVKTVNVETMNHPERVLLCFDGETLTPFVPEGARGECKVLEHHPLEVSLNVRLRPEWIVYTSAGTIEEVLHELLEPLQDDYAELDTASLHAELVAREKEFSSFVGFGVALPHAYVDGIDDSAVLVARHESALQCRHSGEEIRLVFLVLSPRDQPRKHLNALSEISRFVMDQENRERLFDAHDRAELEAVFFPEPTVEVETTARAAGEPRPEPPEA
ncbi:MAG: cation:proton antiporter [Deltaproteobacteria bacterium]|nr:cation:proton antiporter [Deltaproteobacteria bacterium]